MRVAKQIHEARFEVQKLRTVHQSDINSIQEKV